MFKRMISVLGVAALIAVTPLPGLAQARSQAQLQADQQARMQQHISQQMTGMIQQMNRLRERIHQVDQGLAQQMNRTQDQQRLQEHQALRDMCGDFGEVAEQMERNAERFREMSQQQLFQRDPELERDMDRLRQNWDAMGEQLEESVQALERMQTRLREPSGDGA